LVFIGDGGSAFEISEDVLAMTDMYTLGFRRKINVTQKKCFINTILEMKNGFGGLREF
jgi:hypothetical protein